MSGFMNDLRFGVRQLIKRPGFAAAAILTLALGIGANTAVFSVLNGYLLKPLPYPHSNRLAEVGVNFTVTGGGYFSMSVPLYDLIRKDVTAFSNTALYNHNNFNIEINGTSTRIPGVVATASLFQVLGVTPMLGHAFTSAASEPGRGNVAIISNHLWRSSFGANPDVIGRTVRLNGKPMRIIGVMPRGFAFPSQGIDIWAPLTIAPSDRNKHQMFMLSPMFIGRLKPGVELAALQPQLDAVRTHVGNIVSAKDWKQVTNAGFRVHAKSYRQMLLGNRTSTILLLQGAVLLVLLMTCVNVANLLLSRILGRSHEIAMRSALGASRAVLARQLLVESLWLAIPGGLAGIALGWLGLHFFEHSVWTGGGIFNTALDWRVGLAALSMVCITAVLVSVLPIRHLAKTDLQSLLQAGGHTVSQSLRKTIAAVDPSVAVYDIETMHARLARSLHDRQTTMTLLLAFDGIALAPAMVGVYGVLSYAVGQRRRECGIRLALGAMPGDFLSLFIKGGLRLLGIGLIAGLILAVAFGFVLSSRLFGVAPFDPVTLAGTIVALAAITLIACYLPGRRASKLDPAIAMME